MLKGRMEALLVFRPELCLFSLLFTLSFVFFFLVQEAVAETLQETPLSLSVT